MSYTMHNNRLKAIASIKTLLKEHRQILHEKLKVEVMLRHDVSEYTAEKYIREIVKMGIAELKDNGVVVYTFDKRKTDL